LPKQYNAMRGKAMGERLVIAAAFSTRALERHRELVKNRTPELGLIAARLHPRHNMSGNGCTRLAWFGIRNASPAIL
jgi:hypothetical protein